MNSTKEYKTYLAHTLRNWDEIENSQLCGCLNCGKVYPTDIVEECFGEMESDELTAICTFCHETYLVGEASGLKITEDIFKKLKEFRKAYL